MIQTIAVRVPATTANLGPGFDCLGAALTLYNTFRFSRLTGAETELQIVVSGRDADRVSTDTSNLAYQSFFRLCNTVGHIPPPLKLEIEMDVPLARGLGSSATAIVGGLVGANLMLGSPLSQSEVMELAIAIEGHPDNVVPALVGGCRLAASTVDQQTIICDVPWHESLVPVVAIPNFELSTAEARRVLPDQYSRADAIFNAAHVGLLVRSLESGNPNWLAAALQDRIHQPYRQALIKGYGTVQTAAVEAGAYGLVISGAGPTLLAIASPDTAEQVAIAMEQAWQTEGVQPEVKVLQLDSAGAYVQK